MATAPSTRMTVRCDCGAKLKVPTSAEGKRAKCPKCGNPFKIRKPSAPSKPRAPEASLDDSGMGSLLDSLATQAANAPTVETDTASAPPVLCIKCGRMIPSSCETCVHCGSKVDSTTVRSSPRSMARVSHSSTNVLEFIPQSFTMGCVFSALGACIGAGLWFLVCKTTGYEVGYIACGVGALSGVGMMIGNREECDLCGIVAAGMAVGGIVLAKLLFIGFLLGDFAEQDRQTIEYQIEIVAVLIAVDQLEAEIGTTSFGSDEWKAAVESAYAKIESMSEIDIRDMYRARNEEFETAMASSHHVALHVEENGLDLDQLGGSKWAIFKQTLDPLDGLFFLLATVGAFKVAGISR